MTEERNSRDRCGKPEWWSGWEVLQHILGMQWRNFPVFLFYFVVPVHTLSITADQQSRSKIDQTLWKFTATVQSLYARVTRGSRIEEQSFQRYFSIGFLSFLTVWNITTYMLLSVFFLKWWICLMHGFILSIWYHHFSTQFNQPSIMYHTAPQSSNWVTFYLAILNVKLTDEVELF